MEMQVLALARLTTNGGVKPVNEITTLSFWTMVGAVAPEFIPIFVGVHVTRSLVFCSVVYIIVRPFSSSYCVVCLLAIVLYVF
jgi:hypothetical protein